MAIGEDSCIFPVFWKGKAMNRAVSYSMARVLLLKERTVLGLGVSSCMQEGGGPGQWTAT